MGFGRALSSISVQSSRQISRDGLKPRQMVVSCPYQFARMNTLTTGLQIGERFRLLRLWAAVRGRVPVACFDGTERYTPIRYKPSRAEENSYTESQRTVPGLNWLPLAVTWASLLSLLWLGLLRGCS